MKIGVDEGPLSEIDAKLVRCRRDDASPARVYPSPRTRQRVSAAIEELDILDRAGVPLSSFIWVHAHNERDTNFHTRAATRGA